MGKSRSSDSFSLGQQVTNERNIFTFLSQEHVPSKRVVYYIDGNPCLPSMLDARLFLPSESRTLSTATSQINDLVVTRRNSELEEANRRYKMATCRGGLDEQRGCLW